jgi:nitrite reductase/ring-hydroxylating ferredoxin subunit
VNPWDGDTADIACWVRNVDGKTFQVFAINCAHLGCPVRWFPQSGLFLCPCHGGAYYQDGSRASGPPERGLFEYELQDRRRKAVDQSRRDAHAGPGFQYRSRDTNMRLIESIGEWLDARLQTGRPSARRWSIPFRAKPASWFYVFGSAAFVVFLLQIVTGIMLALIYVPSAGEAWNSLQTLNHDVALGWFIRGCMAGARTSWSRSY